MHVSDLTTYCRIRICLYTLLTDLGALIHDVRSSEVSEVHCLVEAVLIGRGKPLVFGECGLDLLLAKCALATSPDDGSLCHSLQTSGASLSSADGIM